VTGDFIAALAAEKRPLRLERVFREMEHQLTPLQLAALLPDLEGRDGFLGKLVASSAVLELLRHEAAETFAVTDPYSGIRLFADPLVPKEKKSLVICLCDNSALLLIPMGQFLQFIPAKQFDVLTLEDEPNRGYENNAGSIRGPMLSWVRRIAEEFEAHRYGAIYCLGASMGGFPALRAGLLFGAKRSVSMAGTLSWPINRLRAGESIDSFDPLCVCRPPAADLVVVFSANHVRDARYAEHIRRVVGARLVPVEGASHNVVQELFLAGKLGAFLGSMLDFDPKPNEGAVKLPPPPKARKDFQHHFERLLRWLGLKKRGPVQPFSRPLHRRSADASP
jgi:hypothetical protein